MSLFAVNEKIIISWEFFYGCQLFGLLDVSPVLRLYKKIVGQLPRSTKKLIISWEFFFLIWSMRLTPQSISEDQLSAPLEPLGTVLPLFYVWELQRCLIGGPLSNPMIQERFKDPGMDLLGFN